MRRIIHTAGAVVLTVAVAGAGATLTASAAPSSDLVYSVDGGASWTTDPVVASGSEVLARLYYDNDTSSNIDGASLTSSVPDGFELVAGSTRIGLNPGTTDPTSPSGEVKYAPSDEGAVWSGDDLTIAPNAGFYGVPNSATEGLMSVGKVRYLNLHQCAYTNGTGGWFTTIASRGDASTYGSGTNASNTPASALDCKPGAGSWSVSNEAMYAPIDILGNRYLNLHQCQYVNSGRWYATFVPYSWAYSSTTNASNTAESVVSCGSGTNSWVYSPNWSGVLAMDLLDNRYTNFHQCQYVAGNQRYYLTVLDLGNGDPHAAATNASNTPDTDWDCAAGTSNWPPYAVYNAVESLDTHDYTRGQGFVEFALTAPVLECEAPDVVASHEGALTSSVTGTLATSGQITVTAADCAENLLVDDEAATEMDTPVTIAVLDNDDASVADEMPEIFSGPSNGSVVVNQDGTITYTPDAGFTGEDTFEYSVSIDGETYTAVVTVIVVDPDDIPIVAPAVAALAGVAALGLAGGTMVRRRRIVTT
ncbi:Ig-like domain-containing protein [Phytoactinopolyspora limicola]|uniref:Ig-like domain-containing protein n=1 Tax=Phytoactinopolyspora limicola TaxID=2715536 RepID=UPI00140DDE0F|nr:Ig-like domain-containing protein [Phytoactinopolyspora limicola]